MQPLQRHLLSSDDDKVPAEFIWHSNFPRGDLEEIINFFLSRAHPAVGRTSGGPCCRRSFGLGRKKNTSAASCPIRSVAAEGEIFRSGPSLCRGPRGRRWRGLEEVEVEEEEEEVEVVVEDEREEEMVLEEVDVEQMVEEEVEENEGEEEMVQKEVAEEVEKDAGKEEKVKEGVEEVEEDEEEMVRVEKEEVVEEEVEVHMR